MQLREEFWKPGRSWPQVGYTPNLVTIPDATGGGRAYLVAVNLFVMTIAPGAKKRVPIVCKHLRRSFLSSPNKSRAAVVNNVDYELLCRGRDNFRILVAITNAVLSRLDMDELVSEVAKEIHYYFDIDDISIVLRGTVKQTQHLLHSLS